MLCTSAQSGRPRAQPNHLRVKQQSLGSVSSTAHPKAPQEVWGSLSPGSRGRGDEPESLKPMAVGIGGGRGGGGQEERHCRKCHEFSARRFLPRSLAPSHPPITLPPAQGAIEKGQNKRGLMRLLRRLWVCPRQLPVARYGYSLPGLPGRKSS